MRKITKGAKRLIIVAGILLLALLAHAEPQTYGLKSTDGADSVYIKSNAKLEFFDGTGKDITGSFQFDPTHPSAGATGVIRFDLRTLKTGIDMRDEHMRERHLNTEQYPYCYYQLTGITGIPDTLKPDSAYIVTGTGEFYIHGVKRALPCGITFKQKSGSEAFAVTATFAVKLDDFNIPRPKAVFMKLAEQIDVSVSFTGYPNAAVEPIALPTDWAELK